MYRRVLVLGAENDCAENMLCSCSQLLSFCGTVVMLILVAFFLCDSQVLAIAPKPVRQAFFRDGTPGVFTENYQIFDTRAALTCRPHLARAVAQLNGISTAKMSHPYQNSSCFFSLKRKGDVPSGQAEASPVRLISVGREIDHDGENPACEFATTGDYIYQGMNVEFNTTKRTNATNISVVC